MKFKFRPIFKEISLTLITQLIVLVSFFFIYRLIAKIFGPEGVGEYTLIRKVISFLAPLLLLGLGVGMPRYIAMSKDERQRSGYIKAGGLLAGIFTIIFLIFINLYKDYFAKIFFGSTNYTNLVLPISLLLMGLVLHSLIYSYFRGRLLVKTFNFLEVINIGLVPIGILLFFFKDITIGRLITLIAVTTLIISFIFLLFFIKEIFGSIQKWQFKNSLKELSSYSLRRIPGDFALAGLLSLGPIIVVHFALIKEAGYLSISQSLLNLLAIGVAPLGTILLPKVSNLISQGRQEIIKQNVNFFISAIFQCFIFISFQSLIFTDIFIKYWLGSEFFSAIPVMRIVFLSMAFYAFYLAIRSILDAIKVKPINTINISISLGIFLLMTGMLLFILKFFTPIISVSIAFTCGLICLGILTYVSIRKIYSENLNKDFFHFWIAVVINILLGGMAILAKPFIITRFYYFIIFEIFLTFIYLLILWLFKIEWIKQIPKKILEFNI